MGADAAKREGCDPIDPTRVTASFGEHGLLYEFQIDSTQKTGFYLDQRDNRQLIGTHASGRRVLDLFCYHGGFAMNAAANGAAQVVAVDSSSSALDIAAANAVRNGCNDIEFYRADCFDFLSAAELEGQLDLIICDPPKLPPSRRDRSKGMSAYRYLIDKCITALAPGGILHVASCSMIIQHEDLRYLIAQTGMKKNREFDCIAVTGQPEDHPWPISFTTGRYLSALTVMDRNLA